MRKVILVDKNDKILGYAPLDESHSGKGKHHRAFVTLILDHKNRVLLQKRKHRLFDGYWDLTAISHPLHLGDRNESYQEASDRAVRKEMGIGHVPINKIGAFNYFAKDGRNCENEYCAILLGHYDGKFIPNRREVYEVKKVDFRKFLKDVKENPTKYTPWAILGTNKLKDSGLNLFKHEIDDFKSVFEPYYKRYFSKKIKSVTKYPPLIDRFYKDLADFGRGGKNLRAFLVYLGYKIAGGKNIDKILPICLAVEIAHNFLLIHDDIIDKSDKRRNKLTIHKRYEKHLGAHYGVSQAVILGDIACFEALQLVSSSGFGDDLKILCQKKLLGVLLETAFGEALDVEYSYKKATLLQIMEVSKLKTAKYSFVGPLVIGSALGNLGKNNVKNVEKYGLFLGQAFQIKDDILGVFGDEKVMGKSVLSDMREGKSTLLIHKAKEMASAKGRQEISALWGDQSATASDLEKIRKIIENCGALSLCVEKQENYISQAKKYIITISANLSYQKLLADLADFVIKRED